MREIASWLVGANQAMAGVTVVIVQMIKMFLPNDPDALPGAGRFSVSGRWKKYLLPLTFFIGVGLSMVFSPHEGKDLVGRVGGGLQTGAYAVVIWEVYSNWVRPFFEKKANP